MMGGSPGSWGPGERCMCCSNEMICSVANSLWVAGCLPELARFRRDTKHVRDVQRRVLERILRANAATAFGRQHGFARIRSVHEYQQRVPACTYEDCRPWIDRIADGAANVLTAGRVRLLEPTGGSTGGTKLIPYTAALQREFDRAIRAWVGDLFLHRPQLLGGPAYWSISPVAGQPTRTRGGIPVGFEDDASYVTWWQRPLVRAVLAVPPDVRHAPDIDAFRYRTLRSLLCRPELRLISVWNPTFLSLLVGCLPRWGEQLLRDIADRRRAREVRTALDAPTPAERHAALWPRLQTISCWTDANAAGAAAGLAAQFPHAEIQGKGLIATEGFVSLPLTGIDGGALAIRSHFFEFLAVDSQEQSGEDRFQLAHELDSGQRYAVVLTTGGGLYRYHLDDLVEVAGQVGRCPAIRFVGRRRHVSDWFGEKLDETFVAGVVREACARTGLAASFAMLACDRALPSPAYVLYVETGQPDELLRAAGCHIETALRASFHYDYARRLDQLGPVRIFRTRHADETYVVCAVRAGQRPGDVKPPLLDRRDGWSQRFHGAFVPPAQPAANIPALTTASAR